MSNFGARVAPHVFAGRSNAIFPTNVADSRQPIIAGLFGIWQTPTPTPALPAPSELGQSFETSCGFQGGGGTVSGIHGKFGNTGFVPLPGCNQVLTNIGDDISFVGQTGNLVILDGTITTIVSFGTFTQSSNQFRCITNTQGITPATAADGQLIRAYYKLDTNQVVLANGSVQYPISCVVTIPQGDDILALTVEWVKS